MIDRIDYRLSGKAWAVIEQQLTSPDASRLRARYRSLPTMLRTSGLVVTLGFLVGRDAVTKLVARELYALVRMEVAGLADTELLFLAKADELLDPAESKIVEASQVAQIAADHLKRAAEVLLPSPTAGDQ